MTGIDNTTEQMRDPANRLGFLLDAAATGSQGAPIERMERDGQQQLVHSDRLPVKFNVWQKTSEEAQAEFEALGFTFGEPDADDPMFRPASLPDGWKREGSDHAMWSYIVDELGRKRVAIFYKAAFYDRDAFMYLTEMGAYVRDHVENGAPLVYDDKWCTREAVAAAMRDARDQHAAEAAEFRGHAADEQRPEVNRHHCAEIAERKEADADKYEAALTALKAGS